MISISLAFASAKPDIFYYSGELEVAAFCLHVRFYQTAMNDLQSRFVMELNLCSDNNELRAFQTSITNPKLHCSSNALFPLGERKKIDELWAPLLLSVFTAVVKPRTFVCLRHEHKNFASSSKLRRKVSNCTHGPIISEFES